MAAGAKSLSDGITQAYNGADALNTGAETLYDGADRLDQGIGTLDEGVSTLLSGMEQFKAEGIDRLTEIFGDEMDDVIERLRLIADGENTYTNFAGADDDAKTSTKFIFKMEF